MCLMKGTQSSFFCHVPKQNPCSMKISEHIWTHDMCSWNPSPGQAFSSRLQSDTGLDTKKKKTNVKQYLNWLSSLSNLFSSTILGRGQPSGFWPFLRCFFFAAKEQRGVLSHWGFVAGIWMGLVLVFSCRVRFPSQFWVLIIETCPMATIII